jgi:hypothetical protein
MRDREKEVRMVKSNQQSPLWAYLLLLATLFVLSVAAPRGWQQPKAISRTDHSLGDKNLVAKALRERTVQSVAKALAPTTFLHADSQRPSEPDKKTRSSISLSNNKSNESKSKANPAELEPLQNLDEIADASLKLQEPILADKVTRQITPDSIPLVPSQGQQNPSAIKPSEASDSLPSVTPPLGPKDDRNAINFSGPSTSPKLTPNPTQPQSAPNLSEPLTPVPAPIIPEADKIIQNASPAEPNVSPNDEPHVAGRPGILRDGVRLRDRILQNGNSAAKNATDAGNQNSNADASADNKPAATDPWPAPEALIERCENLRSFESTRDWANQALAVLETLEHKSASDRSTGRLLSGLRKITESANELIGSLGNSSREASLLRSVQYDLIRRLEIWDDLHTRAFQDGPSATCIKPHAADDRQVLLQIQQINQILNTNPLGKSWQSYLQLDQITDLTTRAIDPERQIAIKKIAYVPNAGAQQSVTDDLDDERRELAKRVLAAASSRDMTNEQHEFLAKEPMATLLVSLKKWNLQPRPIVELLDTIEDYESSRLAGEGRKLGTFITQLAMSNDTRDNTLSRKLDLHYRNANLRMVLTQDVLNHTIPAQAPLNENVDEVISGVQAQGNSTTFNDVKIKLLPNDNQWRMIFVVNGQIETRTASHAGPVIFHSNGASHYVAEKEVDISASGIKTKPAHVYANSKSKLEDLESRWDGFPLIGPVVRNIALRQHADSKEGAEQEVGDKVAKKAGWRVNSEVDSRMNRLESRMQKNVVDRLVRMNLDPALVSMQTTAKRATSRIRLADNEQLGAFTARPQAFNNSVASFQIHESVINNFIDNLDLAGKTFTIPQLTAHINKKLDRDPSKVKPVEESAEDTEITFLDEDPVSVLCEDDRVILNVAISKLHCRKKTWTDFNLVVKYNLESDGLKMNLARDGVVEIEGESQQGRLDFALRGVCAKIFPNNRPITLMPESVLKDPRFAGLSWNQLVVENGWIGLSMTTNNRVVERTMSSLRR